MLIKKEQQGGGGRDTPGPVFVGDGRGRRGGRGGGGLNNRTCDLS